MKKASLLTACALGASLVAVGCVGSPPPSTDPHRDVVVFGDSNGWGIGCILGHDGDLDSPPFPCPPLPDLTTHNAYFGACQISGGTVQLYNRMALANPSCYDWQSVWDGILAERTPEVVLLHTGGWEIVDRWDPFPSGPGCNVFSTYNCPAPSIRWGDGSGTGAARYRARLEAAIDLFRSHGAKVLVLNSPYYDPHEPQVPGIADVWYEAYPATNPPGPVPEPWQPPNANMTYRSGKAKTDELNAVVDAVHSQVYPNDPNVQFYDLWARFSPFNPATGDQEFSMDICSPPNHTTWPTSCPGQAIRARLDFDRTHISEAGYRQVLTTDLLARVREMLA